MGRYLFAAPIPDDLVFSEFLMVFIVFLPLSSVQASREHVFVTIFTEWMPNRKKVVLETFGVFIGLIAFTIVAAAVYTDFKESYDIQAYVEGPLELVEWPARDLDHSIIQCGFKGSSGSFASDWIGQFIQRVTNGD